MGKWTRRLLWTVGILAALAAAGYYPLVVHSPAPRALFPLDIGGIRATAASAIAGAKATEIRYEHVMTMKFFEAMLMAGDPWRAAEMPVYSYQLVFPDRTLIIDTAVPRAMVKPDAMVLRFDDTAYDRVLTAMERAGQIVVTHEHVDHIGGLAAHPRLARILPAVRLTGAQVANRFAMYPAKLPDELMRDYEPLRYDDAIAVAPGVVLIKAPGHTPGSQMVYVQLADGREVIFLGDVSWRRRNIEHVRERPLFITLLIREDRQAVLGQFQALHELAQREPGIGLVPGHDGQAVQRLAEAGLLHARFRP